MEGCLEEVYKVTAFEEAEWVYLVMIPRLVMIPEVYFCHATRKLVEP